MFKKHDADKPRFDLLLPKFLGEMAQVLTLGARKYGDENWKACDSPKRYLAALYRHLNAYHQGEGVDEESGVSHLAHVAVNAMFLGYFSALGRSDS